MTKTSEIGTFADKNYEKMAWSNFNEINQCLSSSESSKMSENNYITQYIAGSSHC